MKKILIVCLIILNVSKCLAQISISFTGIEESNFTEKDLWNFLVVNQASTPRNVSAIVTISSEGSIVASAQSPFFQLHGTQYMRNLPQVNEANVSYTSSGPSTYFQSYHVLDVGKYKLCVKVIANDDPALLSEECTEFSAAPFVSLVQVTPVDEEFITTQYPLLRWQIIPYSENYQYRIKLTPINDGQKEAAALRGVNYLGSKTINETQLQYDPLLPPLESGNSYIWQVVAFKNGNEVARSDVWKFSLGISQQRLAIRDNSFRRIESKVNPDPYLFYSAVTFSYENALGDDSLKYVLLDLSDGNIYRTPVGIELNGGMNNITISSDDLGLVENHNYLLEVRNRNGVKKVMAFKHLVN